MIDKAALAIIFGVTKFHQYLYGRSFTLYTDHRPLERIFGENRQAPKITSNPLLRWAMLLSAYNYKVHYINGKDNVAAVVLSRLPLPNEHSGLPGKKSFITLTPTNTPFDKAATSGINEERQFM